MALPRGQPFCFWREPQEKEGERSYVPKHSSRPCLRARSTAPLSRAPSPALPALAAGRQQPRQLGEPRRAARSGSVAAPQPGSAAALAARPRTRPRQLPLTFPATGSAHLPPSLPPAAATCSGPEPLGSAERGARRSPPSAGGSSRCHFTPTSRRRQLLLLNSRRSGGMKSSSPPPPRAAALRSRRGGGDGPSAGPPEPRGALALHPHPRGRHSCSATRTPLPGRLRGAARSLGGAAAARLRVGGPSPGTAAGWAAPPRANLPLSGVPSASCGERGAPAQQPVACGPLQPPPPCPAPRPRRSAQPGRTGLSGEERGRAGRLPQRCKAGAKGEPPPGELCMCVSLF